MRAHILLGLTLFPLAAMAEPPRIVTDMPVTASLAAQVLGDLGQPDALLDAGSDPHDFQLRPSQARALQDAGLLIWMGPEMTVWLQDAAGLLGEDRQMQLLHQPGTHLREFGETNEDVAAHDDGHEHDHEHAHGALDPHAWLDPDNGALWLGLIAERLTEMDPENAATYRANAKAATEALSREAALITDQLRPAQAHPFVSFHDAYGYFTEHFGLPEAVTVAIGDASAPSAARLQEARARIEASGASCVFPEAGHSPRMLDTATEGLGLKTGETISPTGVDIDAGTKLYSEVLKQLAARITSCASST